MGYISIEVFINLRDITAHRVFSTSDVRLSLSGSRMPQICKKISKPTNQTAPVTSVAICNALLQEEDTRQKGIAGRAVNSSSKHSAKIGPWVSR